MRSDQYLKRALTITFTLGAIAAPATSASAQAGSFVRPNPDQQAAQLGRGAGARPAQTSSVVQPNPDQQTPVTAPATIVRVSTPSSGFDWGDAGIGAAGGLALSMIAVGGALAVSQNRARRPTA